MSIIPEACNCTRKITARYYRVTNRRLSIWFYREIREGGIRFRGGLVDGNGEDDGGTRLWTFFFLFLFSLPVFSSLSNNIMMASVVTIGFLNLVGLFGLGLKNEYLPYLSSHTLLEHTAYFVPRTFAMYSPRLSRWSKKRSRPNQDDNSTRNIRERHIPASQARIDNNDVAQGEAGEGTDGL